MRRRQGHRQFKAAQSVLFDVLGLHGAMLWIYRGVVSLEVVGAAAFVAWMARHRVDEPLERLVGTALLLRKHGYDEASTRLLRTARETHGRRAVERAGQARS